VENGHRNCAVTLCTNRLIRYIELYELRGQIFEWSDVRNVRRSTARNPEVRTLCACQQIFKYNVFQGNATYSRRSITTLRKELPFPCPRPLLPEPQIFKIVFNHKLRRVFTNHFTCFSVLYFYKGDKELNETSSKTTIQTQQNLHQQRSTCDSLLIWQISRRERHSDPDQTRSRISGREVSKLP
jgi:hypothetical protein